MDFSIKYASKHSRSAPQRENGKQRTPIVPRPGSNRFTGESLRQILRQDPERSPLSNLMKAKRLPPAGVLPLEYTLGIFVNEPIQDLRAAVDGEREVPASVLAFFRRRRVDIDLLQEMQRQFIARHTESDNSAPFLTKDVR